MKILPCGIAVLEGDLWASRWIEEQGKLDYDPTISKVLEPMLKPGDTAIDVGAMLGAYAFGLKRAVGPTGRVIAFEPNPKAFECLKHNCPDVNCFNMALGNQSCACSIRRSQVGSKNYGASEVFFDENSNIPMTRLDDFIKTHPEITNINLIKIDVEGFDGDVILGGLETVKQHRPAMFVEINHEALAKKGCSWSHVVKPFTDIGYRVKFIGEGHNFNQQEWPEMDVILAP